MIVRFLKNEDGATAIEYALIAGLVSISIIASISQIAPVVSGILEFFAGVIDDV